MADPKYVLWVQPSCNAGTTAANFTKTAVGLPFAHLWEAEFRIPPGHQGTTGIALWDSGAFVIPKADPDPAWLIGDDDLLPYPYDKELGANVQLVTYNNGSFVHTWQVRLVYTPMTLMGADDQVIITPDVADWLAESGAELGEG